MSTTQKRSSSGCLVSSITFFFGALLFLIFLFGLGFLISSVYYAAQSAHMQNSGVQTQAIVVTTESVQCGKNAYGYTYTVRFTNQRGQAQTATLDCLASRVSRGTAITIVYLPDNPTFIELPSQVGSSPTDGVVIILICIFVCLLVLVGFILWVRNGKEIISSMMEKNTPAVSRQPRVAGYSIEPSSTFGASRDEDASRSVSPPPDLRDYWTDEPPASPPTSQFES
jgi:hypothetical protein